MKNINILKDLKTLNKLHTSSVESYTTNNGIVDFTCNNAGYVDNVAIEGKTLVNLWDVHNLKLGGQSSVVGNRYKCVTSASNRYSDFWASYSMLKPNTTYTVTYNIIQNTLPTEVRAIAITRDHTKNPHAFNEIVEINGGVTGIFTTKLTTKDSFTDVAYGLRSFVDNSTMGDGYVVELEIVLLEGDYTNTPISYFEGLKSVGQGDKIEVLTINGSKYDLSGATYANGFFNSAGGLTPQDEHRIIEQFLEVEEGKTYVLENIAQATCYYDVNKNLIHYNIDTLICNSPYPHYIQDIHHVFYSVVKIPKGIKYIRVSTGINSVGKINIYKDGKYDHKQISTTLRSLPNGVKDTIEKRGNKYVKVQRCRELRLDGNSTFFSISEVNSSTKVYRALLDVPLKDNKSGGKVFCDRFNSYANWGLDEEECYVSINNTEGNAVCLKILKSRLENTMTKEKLLAWLGANPTTIVYELKTPIITELPNFNPQTYKGENTLILNSGVIQCDASFDVCEGIRSELDVIKDKVSSLDDYESGYEFSNEVIYLNGTWKPGFAENPYIVRIGKMCILHCAIGNDAPQRGMHVLKLPSFAKPKDHHRCAGRAKINDGTINPILVDYDITLDNTVQLWTTHETTKLNEMYIHMVWEVE